MNTLAIACPGGRPSAWGLPFGARRRHSGNSGRSILPLPDFGVSDSATLSVACAHWGTSGNSGRGWTGRTSGASTGSAPAGWVAWVAPIARFAGRGVFFIVLLGVGFGQG